MQSMSVFVSQNAGSREAPETPFRCRRGRSSSGTPAAGISSLQCSVSTIRKGARSSKGLTFKDLVNHSLTELFLPSVSQTTHQRFRLRMHSAVAHGFKKCVQNSLKEDHIAENGYKGASIEFDVSSINISHSGQCGSTGIPG